MNGFCPLASGSKGNSIFFGSQETKILIDAGLSARATERRLQELAIGLDEIEAILISHDHSDHIQGLKMLALRYRIPVIANAETAKGIYASLGACPKFHIFTTGAAFTFKDLKIHPFSIQHDTADPVAFTVETDGIRTGFCTDLGFATSLVKNHLQECDYLFVEANHEPHMVHACSRPMIYKQRVLSKSGHLSNDDCAELVAHIAHKELKHIHLAHLSQECNHPQTALEKVRNKLTELGHDITISIAPQEKNAEPIYFC